MLYNLPKWTAQDLIVRAKIAGCEMKVFVIDANEICHAVWNTQGVHVKNNVTKEEADYLRLNYFSKPHLAISVVLSERLGQYLLLGVWGSEETLAKLKDKYLTVKETENENGI